MSNTQTKPHRRYSKRLKEKRDAQRNRTETTNYTEASPSPLDPYVEKRIAQEAWTKIKYDGGEVVLYEE